MTAIADSPRRAGADHELPSVSILIPTYNFARFIGRSIDSALAQDYPSDKLEVIVVDDGSTDATPEIVARYGRDVRYVRKENGGVVSSLNRLLEESTGELLCIQSGDDVSFPARVRTQAAAFHRRPELGLHYCDMSLIDAQDALLHASWFRWLPLVPERGRNLPSAIVTNLAAGGSMMLNRAFLHAFYPIPESAGVEDWWITLRVSEVAEIDYTERALYGYRRHKNNLSLGAQHGEERLVRHERGVLPLRRFIATRARCPAASAGHWDRVWSELMDKAHLLARHGHDLRGILTVEEGDRRAAAAELMTARVAWAEGRRTAAVRAAVAAYGHDPFDEANTEAASAVILAARAAGGDRPFTARAFAILTSASSLLQAPELLRAYGRAFRLASDASLVIACEPSALGPLVALVAACGLDGEDGPDLVAVGTGAAEGGGFEALLPFVDAVLSVGDGRSAHGARLIGETYGLAALHALSLTRTPALA